MRLGFRVVVVSGLALAASACLLVLSPAGLAARGQSGAARSDGPALDARPSGRMWGVVPAALRGASNPHRPTWSEFAGTKFASGGNLTYHGGPVMRTNTVHTIYWGFSSGTTYQTLIDGFFGNVAAASGAASNVYAVATQYSDSTGPIAYSSTFGGAWVDSATAIPDHCSSEYSGSGVTVSGCILDTDVQAEVARAINANPSWVPGPGTIYFVFTPRNVGSCFDSTSKTCAFTYYCAYHSNYVDGQSRDVIYANQPYTDTSGVGAPGVCDSGQHPNGDWADATINVVSHEHNEAITDADGNAWYDSAGNENGDKCAWNFGSSLGSTGSGLYNQAIGSGRYYLQQEWSNSTSGCALTYGSVAKAATQTSAASSPNPSVVGQSVTLTATVTSASGTPTGTVQFRDGSTNLGSPQTLGSGGVATLVTTSLGKGSHSVTAVYGGDANYTTSTSSALTQTVNAAATQTGLTSSANPSVAGQTVTFTATVTAVSPGSGTPTGTVQFMDGSTSLGSPQALSGSGKATLTTAALGLGGHSISAVYGGDANYTGSSSGTVTQTVNRASTQTGVTSSANPSAVGQSVTFTATVQVVSPGSGTPTGTVQFMDGSTALGSPQALSGSGTATLATAALAQGSHTITAVYSGDGSDNGSTSGQLTQTVNTTQAPDFALGVSPSSQAVARGGSVAYSVAITPAGGFSGAVTLSVSGLPSRASATFSANPATTASTLTVTTRSRTPRGTFVLTVTGVSGSLTHTAQVTLVVQ